MRSSRVVGVLAIVGCVGLLAAAPAAARSGGGDTVRVDVTGARKAHLRGTGPDCTVVPASTGPSFYRVTGRQFHALGRHGFLSAVSATKGIPGVAAYGPHPASITVRIGPDLLDGVAGRDGTITSSQHLRRITFDVRLHRQGRGAPIHARVRGTITCTDRDIAARP